MKKHLALLSTLHYVYGILTCLGAFAVLGLVGLGFLIGTQADDANAQMVGGVFKAFGWVLFAVILLWGILILLSGRWIAQRRNRTGSLVIGGLCCLSIPLGLALGIFTFVVLMNDEVQAEYAGATGRS
jgi:thiosulfate reductase cytochrome b subunit